MYDEIKDLGLELDFTTPATDKDIEEFYHGISKANMPEPNEEFQFGAYTIFIFEKNLSFVQIYRCGF